MNFGGQGSGAAMIGPADGDLACGVAGTGRMCEPEEVADLMAFLAGGRADYITGVTVTIAGGKTLI